MDFGIERKIDGGKLSGILEESLIPSYHQGKSRQNRKSEIHNPCSEADRGGEPEDFQNTALSETKGKEAATGTNFVSLADKDAAVGENFPYVENPGELDGKAGDMAQSSDLLKMKKQILQKRLWLGINPAEKSDEFAEMLRSMDLFYKKLGKRKAVRPPTGLIPGRPDGKTPVSTLPGKPSDNTNMSYTPAMNNSGDNIKPSDETPRTDKPIEKPAKPEEKPDSTAKTNDASKKEDQHKKALDDAHKDSRKEEAERLQQVKQTNRDREEKQKMEKVAGLAHEIKEINSGIRKLENEIHNMESNLEELEAENRDNPDFDPEPYRDEIEDKKIHIEMMQMKKDLKKLEIESLMGKTVFDESYEENVIDYTISERELHRERFDEAEYKSKETLKGNLEFLEDYRGDKKGADVISHFSVDGKETGTSETSSKLQSLIENKFDVKLDPVEIKKR